MQRLLSDSGGADRSLRTDLAIGRARLLTHLGRLGDAEEVLEPIASKRGGADDRLRGEAFLRLAIVASQLGDRGLAAKRAREAERLLPEGLEGRVERYHGWEALYSGSFEPAIERFESALSNEREPEDRADATIGAALAELRLGRLRAAELRLDKLAVDGLRRITRNRVVRAKATACSLRGKHREGIEILDGELGHDGTRPALRSADLLEARAYLNTKLGPDSLAEADDDLNRSSEKLLTTEDAWQKAVIHYLRGLIEEAKMRATPHLREEFRQRARECAAESVKAARANPWHQARAHTLLGRLDADGDDSRGLVGDLRAAAEAHRKLDPPCPDVLGETLALAATAARAWSLPAEAQSLEAMVAELAPRHEPADFDRDRALLLLDRVAGEVESRPRPDADAGAGGANVAVLGAVGELLLHAAANILAQGGEPELRLLHPRRTPFLAAGVYDLDRSSGELTPTAGMPSGDIPVVKGAASRRFATQHLAAVLLASSAVDGSGGTLRLGRWYEVFSAAARNRGIAVVEPIAIEPRALKVFGLHSKGSFVALGLAELPVLPT
jgi:tetratricopeptide (TPR) repeat protein